MTPADLHDLANEVLTLRRLCRDHPMPLPKPTCPECARNGGIVAAAHRVKAAHGHEWSDWTRSASCESRYCLGDDCDAGEIR